MERRNFVIGLLFVFIFTFNITSASVVIITANSTPVEGFVPSLATAVTGDTIKWVNGNGQHTTASTSIPPGAASWNSPTIGGSGFTYVVAVPGTYNYTCHPSGGGHMDASIVVSDPAPVAVINIPNDFPTIQQGINASNVGDTVLVSPGTYFENINFTGKNIVVASLYLTTGDKSYIDQTIINGRDSSSVVTFTNGEGAAALISGFTIRNGYGASWLDGNGGGICCINASPTIDHNLIDSNMVSFADGGGIYCENSSSIITNNNIVFNGGGYVIIGSGIACNGGAPYIAYNTITGSWGDSPNGIDLFNSSATVINNTIVFNEGSGIFIRDTSDVSVSNTIIWGNNFQSINILDPIVSNVIVTFSDVEGGYIGTGNIDLSPVFTDSLNNDFSLQSSSPCIDVADPGSPFDPDGTRSDMGALFFEQNVGINNDDVTNGKNNIKIFPNPFSAYTSLEFENNNGEKHTLLIYNSMGQMVRAVDNIKDGQITINRESLTKGIYFLHLMNKSEIAGIGTVIVE